MNGNTPIFGNEPRSAKPSNLRIIVSTEEEDRRKGHAAVTAGDWVFYRITKADLEEHATPDWNDNVQPEQLLPALVTRVFSGYTFANMTVFSDNGSGPGCFQVFSRAFFGRIER